MKKALITGVTGMVGSHLADYLLSNTSWKIFGACRWRSPIENIQHLNKRVMTDSNYKKYSDLTLEELEDVVQDIENMSLAALKQQKKDLRITMLKTVQEAKKEIEKRLKK